MGCSNDRTIVTNDEIGVERFFEAIECASAECGLGTGSGLLVEEVNVSTVLPTSVSIGEQDINGLSVNAALLKTGLCVSGVHRFGPFLV